MQRTAAALPASLTGDVSALLGDGAFHKRHRHEHERHHGENPGAVEIGQGESLLLAEAWRPPPTWKGRAEEAKVAVTPDAVDAVLRRPSWILIPFSCRVSSSPG
jgi:hypothetical protein